MTVTVVGHTVSTVRVGRITGRLPKELADEVVGSLLESFKYDPFLYTVNSFYDAFFQLSSVFLCKAHKRVIAHGTAGALHLLNWAEGASFSLIDCMMVSDVFMFRRFEEWSVPAHVVVPVVLKALVYDERRGSYSVGK